MNSPAAVPSDVGITRIELRNVGLWFTAPGRKFKISKYILGSAM